MTLQIIPTDLLQEYLLTLPAGLQVAYDRLQDAELSTPNFSFYTSVASVFSSKIEGENIELDSYIKYKRDGISFQPDYTKKIDDLYSAYQLAHAYPLNEEHVQASSSAFEQTHGSKHLAGKVSDTKYVCRHG